MNIRNVAVQMDPVSTINIHADSTFALMLEAQRRGYEQYHYTPADLVYSGGKVYANARLIKEVKRDQSEPVEFATEKECILLEAMDVILLRQDPPFDMQYITSTHLLEMLPRSTLVVNDPHWVRNSPEKIFVTEFPDLMPPTAIVFGPDEVKNFRKVHPDMIVKPLFGNGGSGVFHIKPDDENLSSLLEMHWKTSREPLMLQAYCSAVRNGDKRIILVDGHPIGAVNRVPAKGEARANLHVGGAAQKTTLTVREKEICQRIGPKLRDRGQIFVGIDVIGDYITEINVTSPTGIHQINAFDGIKLESVIWDAILHRFNYRKDWR